MDVRRAATDIAYVAIGFAVLAYQRTQVRRRDIERALRTLPCHTPSGSQAK